MAYQKMINRMHKLKRQLPIFLAVVTLVLASLACAVFPPGVIPPAKASPPTLTATSTPTGIIQAVELTPTPEVSATRTPSSPNQFTISGTYESMSDVIVTDKNSSVHTQSHMKGNFLLKSAPGNHLTGTGQLTWDKSYQIGGEFCKTSWDTGSFVWSIKLGGNYQKQPDGSLQFSFKASPVDGPSYTVNYLCLNSTTEHPSFPGAGGTLINGKYDFSQDYPAEGSDTSGETKLQYHFELAP
jgi:hypothetical protein